MSCITRPSIIDVEASGFGSDSYPIEIGAVLTSGERYCSLILPVPEWTHWDGQAAKVHGITRAFLEKNGRPVTEVAKALNSLLAGRTVYSDGWGFDLRWITQLFYTAGIYQQFKVSALENILSEAQMTIWHEVKNQVVAETKFKRHRATNDALIIQETYARTCL
jgi:DNA polymerase III epsilon subunit-like protein